MFSFESIPGILYLHNCPYALALNSRDDVFLTLGTFLGVQNLGMFDLDGIF